MRALKIAGAAIAAVIVVIALLLVIGIPSGFLTAQIQERVERETGYKLADQWRRQDRPVAIAQHHAERRHAAASEGPRHQPPLRGRKHRGRGDARQPVGRQAAYHRARRSSARWLNLPLRRERDREANPASKPAAGKATDAFSIEHISVTGGTIVFSNLRDRVENRIETVNADITIDADRKIVLTGSARRNGYPLKFEIKAAPPAAADRAAEHPGRDQDRRARPVARPAHRPRPKPGSTAPS